MILEGANKLKEENEYVIYAMNSTTAGQYCTVIPVNSNGVLNMLIDLHQKKLFDEVTNGTKTKDELTNELTGEYQKIKETYPNGILIFPIIDEAEYLNAINNTDKQKMFDETKKIGAITSELYKKLTDSGIEKQNINQKIIMIEKEENDKKYVEWLKEQMPGFVEGVSLEPKQEQSTETPVINDIFGSTNEEVQPTEQPEIPAPQSTEGIVGPELATAVPEAPAPEIPIPAPVAVSPTVEPANPIPVNNDVFGMPSETPAPQPVPQQTPEVTPEPVQQAPTPEPTPEAPKPVQNVALEGTTTFSPIPNNNENPTGNEQPASEAGGQSEQPKKNGGFVNLAILLVVLIGVTIASIELGKFLYSVYGA